MMSDSGVSTELLVTGVPKNCDEVYLRNWIEARGFKVSKVRLIQDTVSRTETAFARVQLMDRAKLREAVRALDRQHLQKKTIRAKEVPVVATASRGVPA
jgi:hypothetical protein